MKYLAERERGGFFPAVVLLVGILICALVLWAGPKLAGWALPTVSATDPTRAAAIDETMASIVVFGLLLVAGLAAGFLCGVNAVALGPKFGVRLLEGGGIGLAGLIIATALAGIAGLWRHPSAATSVVMFVWGTAVIILQAGSEEIFFRGWLQPILVRAWGPVGILVTAIVFAGLHLVSGADALMSILNLFLGGLLFGLLAARYGGIASAIGAHFAWNWTEQLLLGLDPNPGVGSFGSILNLDLIGSAWWGGSDEGLNASVAMTIALAALLAPLLIIGAKARQPLEQHRHDRVAA